MLIQDCDLFLILAPYYDDQLSGHVTIEEVEIEPHHYQLYDRYDHRHYEYD